MSSGFTFDETKSFDENFESFLSASEQIDPEMASILRTYSNKLAEIVKDGDRSSSARTEFNDQISAALDALVLSTNAGGEN